MIDLRESLKLFIARQVQAPASSVVQAPVSFFEVRHAVQGSGESLVGRVGVLGREEATPEGLAEEIAAVCEQDAEGFHGRAQTYWVYCHRDGMGRYDCRRSVTVYAPSSGEGGDLEASSPPNAPGLTADAMRHTEVMTRIAVDAAMSVQKKNESEWTRMAKRIETLERGRDEVSEKMGELAKQYNQGQVELLKAIREDRQHALIFKQLDLVAPAVVAKLLPGATVGAHAKGGDALTDFLLSLSTVQKRSLLSVFGAPEEAFVLKELLDAAEAGKHASFEDEILRRLVAKIPREDLYQRLAAVNETLRPEQQEMFEKVIFPYLAEVDPEAAAFMREEKTKNGVQKEGS